MTKAIKIGITLRLLLIQPGLHAPEPVGPSGSKKMKFKDRTAPGSKTVRGPGGARIPEYNDMAAAYLQCTRMLPIVKRVYCMSHTIFVYVIF